MSRAAARGRNSGELDGIIWFLPFAALAGGAVVGIPGVGLYVGLVFSVWAFKVAGTRSDANEELLGALSSTVGHPFSSHVRTGPGDKWWPPNRLAAWWSLLGAGLLAAVPLVIHSASTLRLPHPLTVPGLALVSFVGYFSSLHALVAAKRNGRPPVVVERSVLREKSESVIGATIVGASGGVIAFLAFAHASTIRALASTGHTAKFFGPDAYAGLGMKGAIGASLGIAFLAAFALASAAYKTAWLAPHFQHQDKLSRWDAAWLTAVGNMAPPLFISEASTPEDGPQICSALFQVPPGGTLEAYAAKADRLATALGVELVSITPDVGRDEANAPMLGSSSTTVFKVSYPLVPIAPGAHLSRAFTTKGELYDFIVASTFRGIFAELKLGHPNLIALSILTTPDSPGRLVETMWMLGPGTTFDQVAKATNAITEKSGAKWLRVGRRSSMYPDEEMVPPAFVSVLFGDPPSMAEFVDGRVFSAEDHQRFVDMIDWDARFRSVGLASAVSGPTLVDVEDIERDLQQLTGKDVALRVWTFTYPAGLSESDVDASMEALKASGLPFVALRRVIDDPNRFQLITADVDPLALSYPFLKAAPRILHRPAPGKPRLTWTVGVGPDGDLVEFQFGTDDPHLLVAGMTGSGKSMSLISMLLQLATANTPADLQLRLVDPKTALVPFRNLAHVTHFVMNRPGRSRYQDFLDLLHDTGREMDVRYERINELGLEDLAQAKEIGHMTDVPYILVVVEEAGLMLKCQDKPLEREIVEAIGKIANLGRGAGVYVVLATQYPTNESVPNHLREQFSRIGFKVQDWRASNIIINESGLEDLALPGQGKMRCGGVFVPFRGFFLHPGDGPANLDVAGEEELEGITRPRGRQPDRTLVLSHLPQASAERRVTGRGSWEPTTLPPVPAGIWDDEE